MTHEERRAAFVAKQRAKSAAQIVPWSPTPEEKRAARRTRKPAEAEDYESRMDDLGESVDF